VEESTVRIRELQSEINRQQRLEQDILMAAEVQRNLLPVGLPVAARLRVFFRRYSPRAT
jgi:hypothetical protein